MATKEEQAEVMNPAQVEEEGAGGETVLTITNHHYRCCGVPPTIDQEKGPVAYFQNRHGEQIVMQYDKRAKTCTVWHADVGWEEPLQIVRFRDRILVLFVRSSADRRRQFKMNTQFDTSDMPSTLSPEARKEQTRTIRRTLYQAVRRSLGKPRLTDEECDYVLNHPILSEDEYKTMVTLFEMWEDAWRNVEWGPTAGVSGT